MEEIKRYKKYIYISKKVIPELEEYCMKNNITLVTRFINEYNLEKFMQTELRNLNSIDYLIIDLQAIENLTSDDEIISSLPIAFDRDLGFITASPSNLGTGMRASVMCFLPACSLTGNMEDIILRAKDNGLTVRGIYGEGSKALGYFYQISNQGSLGQSEDEIIDKVSEFIYSLCGQEKELRDSLLETNYDLYKDKCFRAYGVLANCYSLGEEEMLELLSQVKLGSVLGFIRINSDDKYQKLYYQGMSANLKEIFEISDKKKENIVRAEYISNMIKELTKEVR